MHLSIFYHHSMEAARQKKMDMDQIFQQVKEAGIEALELDRDELTPCQELETYLDKYHLKVSCIYGFYDFQESEDQDRMEKHLEMVQKYRAERIMIIPGFFRGYNTSNQEQNWMLERTRNLVSRGTALGIQCVIEDFDHIQSPIHDYSGMKVFLEEIPDLKVAYDTGNFIFGEEDALEVFDQLRDRIVHVHCKDRYLAADARSPKCLESYAPAPAGKGVMRIEPVCRALLDTGYQGYFVIEHFDTTDYLGDLLESARWLLSIETERK